MHPPFGFALFFLRSVAPDKPYVDRVTQKVIQPVTTMQIYKGAVPFVLIQLVMVGTLIAFPGIVTGSLDQKVKVDMDAVGTQMMESLGSDNGYGGDAGYGSDEPTDQPETPASDAQPAAESGNDPLKAALEEAAKPAAAAASQ